MKHQFSSKIIWIFGILILGLVAVNALLLQQNLQMRTQLSKSQPQKLEIGDKVPSFVAKDLTDKTVNVEFSHNSEKRFLLYFTPTCPYCKQQFLEWKELISQVRGKNIEVIGIVSENEKKEEIEKYLNTFDCGVNSETSLQVLFVPNETLQNYKLNLTPTTILLSDDGKVEQNWIGKWKGTDKILAFNLLNN